MSLIARILVCGEKREYNIVIVQVYSGSIHTYRALYLLKNERTDLPQGARLSRGTAWLLLHEIKGLELEGVWKPKGWSSVTPLLSHNRRDKLDFLIYKIEF